MPVVHALCGQSGAGKTTLAQELKKSEAAALVFSIDQWMHRLFSPDMRGLDIGWIVERVVRAEEQIYSVAEQTLGAGVSVVLDLGFQTAVQRARLYQWSAAQNAELVLHHLDVPRQVRSARVRKRNEEKEPGVYCFGVTELMFDAMEGRFEAPTASEVPGTYRHRRAP